MRTMLEFTDDRTLQPAMPGLLHKAGSERAPVQAFGGGDAGSHRASSWEPWPGSRSGIRRPDLDETPLSESEVHLAIEWGLI